MRLTKLELDVWVAAYAARQPRMLNNTRGGEDAKYWAACAVFHLRNLGEPSCADIEDMFVAVRRINEEQEDNMAGFSDG